MSTGTPWLCIGRLVEKMNDTPYMRLQLMLVLDEYPFHLIHIVGIIPLTASPAKNVSRDILIGLRFAACTVSGVATKGQTGISPI